MAEHTAENDACDPMQYEGDIAGYVEHLVTTHGVAAEVVAPYRSGLTQGVWLAVDRLHDDVRGRVLPPGERRGCAPKVFRGDVQGCEVHGPDAGWPCRVTSPGVDKKLGRN